MARILTASIFAAIVLFGWSMVSWMVLPWHTQTLHAFKDQQAVAKVIKDNVDKSGMYLLPSMQHNPANSQAETGLDLKKTGPVVFTSVYLNGMGSMQPYLIKWFFIELLAAFFVGCLLSTTCNLGYFYRVGFVMCFAVAASITGPLANWNWWHFEKMYTLVSMGDLIAGWYFAGLVLAAFIKGKQDS